MSHTEPHINSIANLFKQTKRDDLTSANLENNTSSLSKQGKKIPPVHTWQPQDHFDMDLTIKSNGEWWHEGTKIIKEKLVTLFASILWCEESTHPIDNTNKKTYFLQSPVEKAKITVEDVPLMITSVQQFHEKDQDWLLFATNTGDIITADAHHPIFMNTFTDTNNKVQSRAYIRVRRNLVAFINRNTFYELISFGELIDNDTQVTLTLNSGGEQFHLIQPI